MNSRMLVALLFFMAPVVGSAQSTQNSAVQDRAQGYLFFGINPAERSVLHAGGGADFGFSKDWVSMPRWEQRGDWPTARACSRLALPITF